MLDCRAPARCIGTAGVCHHVVGKNEDEHLFLLLLLVNAGLCLLLALSLGLVNLLAKTNAKAVIAAGKSAIDDTTTTPASAEGENIYTV